MQNHEVSRIPPGHTSPLRQVCNRAVTTYGFMGSSLCFGLRLPLPYRCPAHLSPSGTVANAQLPRECNASRAFTYHVSQASLSVAGQIPLQTQQSSYAGTTNRPDYQPPRYGRPPKPTLCNYRTWPYFTPATLFFFYPPRLTEVSTVSVNTCLLVHPPI